MQIALVRNQVHYLEYDEKAINELDTDNVRHTYLNIMFHYCSTNQHQVYGDRDQMMNYDTATLNC